MTARSFTFSALLAAAAVAAEACSGMAPALAAQVGPSGRDSQGATISGQVLDAFSRSPVSGAEVRLAPLPLKALADLQGRFMIRHVPAGVYILQVRRIGYEPLASDSLRVAGDTTVALELPIKRLAFQLQEVTVTPGSFSIMESDPAARQVLSRADIESAPFGEDLFRAVHRLPGLSSGDYTAHFSIRGGRHDETLILLDGLELFEPYHLKDNNEGALSIVDVEAVEGVELLTGGFPARYGDRRSGVFSIASRTPRDSGVRYTLGLSLTNARALAEGTFAGQRGSWLVSARRGYIDLVLGLINKNELPSPRYEDVFGVLRYLVHPRHALSFNILHAGDRYRFNAPATTGFRDSIPTRETAGNRYGNSYAWLALQSLAGPRLRLRTMASASLVTSSRNGTEFYLNRPGAIYSLDGSRDFSILGLKQDWTWEPSSRMIVEFGADLRTLRADYALTSVVGQSPDDPSVDTTGYYPQTTQTGIRRSGTTLAAYLSSRLHVLNPLAVELGLRYEGANYSHDRDVSPRVNAVLRLSQHATLRAGWGHYRQRQGIADLAALSGLNRYFPSELSTQWTLGFEHLFGDGSSLRLEGYHKRGSRLRPIYRNWKGSINVFPESDEDRILVYPDRSTASGIELYHSRELGTRWSLRGGYALAFANERVPRIVNVNDPTPIVYDRTHPIPQDQRHALNLDLTWRPGRTWSINTAFTFHTGWPATTERLVPVAGPSGQPDFTVKPDRLYSSRLPAYHRLDVRATRRRTTRRGEFRFFVEVINLTNHLNVLGYDYVRIRDASGGITLEQNRESWFTILPSLGVEWSGRF